MSELAPRIRELFAALDHAGEPSQDALFGIKGGEAGREALGTRVRWRGARSMPWTWAIPLNGPGAWTFRPLNSGGCW